MGRIECAHIEGISANCLWVVVLEMGEDKRCSGDVADSAGADGDVLDGSPPLLQGVSAPLSARVGRSAAYSAPVRACVRAVINSGNGRRWQWETSSAARCAIMVIASGLFPAFDNSSRKARNARCGVQEIPFARTISLRSPHSRGSSASSSLIPAASLGFFIEM